MPDIRTTRVALLVDREVDRDVRTSRVALLVDRETDCDLELSELTLVADIEYQVDLELSDILVVVDIELATMFNVQEQADEFRCWTLNQTFNDILDQTDNFILLFNRYFTDFTEVIQPVDMTFVPDAVIDLSYPAGYPLHNLQNAWVAGSQWSIVDGILKHTNTGTGVRTALIWYEPGVFEDVTATAKVKFDGTDVKRPGIVLHASGDATNETGYCFYPRRTSARVEIIKYSVGAGMILATQAFTFVGDVWYNIKAECTGPTVRMKFWLDGTDEPETWTLSTTDVDEIPTMASNTVPSGVASASSIFSAAYAAWKAMDGISTTFWATTTAGVAPCHLQYDFPTNFEKVITKYSIRCRDTGNTGAPKDWVFQGHDGSQWVVLDTQVDQTDWTVGGWRSYSFTNTTACKAFRLAISANNGNTTTNIAEFQLNQDETKLTIPRGYCGFFDFDNDGISYSDQLHVTGTPMSPTDWWHGWQRNASQCVPYVENNQLKVWNSSAAGVRKLFAWGEVVADNEVEITTRVSSSLVLNAHLLRLQCNGITSESGYSVGWLNASTLRIVRYYGSDTDNIATFTYEIANNEWINLRFYHNRIGKILRLRVWRDGEEEPTDWQIDTTDTQAELYDAKGFVGVGSWSADNSVQTYDFIGVGTHGQLAPREAL